MFTSWSCRRLVTASGDRIKFANCAQLMSIFEMAMLYLKVHI
ncbi:hypothetical protein LMG33818_001361 [Halomonadaceae bacterium LMG 33818]